MENRAITPHQAQWLSLIRYQMAVAREQSDHPAPLSSLALSSMQDAAESTVRLCAEAAGVPLAAREDFDAQVSKVVAAGPAELGAFTNGLRAMNRARVGFKHAGNRADDGTVRQHLDVTERAIAAFVEAFFGVNFADVSMLLLISSESVRDRLILAEWERAKGDNLNALADLSVAFDTLLNEYRGGKSHYGVSPFSVKPPFIDRPKIGRRDPYTGVHEWLTGLDEGFGILLMGVDPIGWARFKSMTARVYHVGGGGGFFLGIDEARLSVSDSDWSWAVRFVVETSLRFDAHPFEVKPGSAAGYQIQRSGEEDAELIAAARRASASDGVTS